MAVSRATESPSARLDGAPPCMPNTSVLGSSGPSLVTVDLFANRPDPPNPPDLSDRRGSRLFGPTSPTQQSAPEGDDSTLMTTSDEDDVGQGVPMSEPKAHCPSGGDGDHDDAATPADVVVDENDAQASSRLNKGKAPETAYPLSAPLQQARNASAEEEAAHDDEPQVQIHAGAPTGNEQHSGTPVDLIADTTNHHEGGRGDSESCSRRSSRATQPESQDSQDSSYPSSLFEEPGDHHAAATALVGEAEKEAEEEAEEGASSSASSSWKQKEKQKAEPAVAETGSPSEASEGEQPFRPLDVGDLGWEKSAGRPPTKLPIRFRDAVGRNFLFPWEKAKTWAGMRKLVNSCFIHVDVLGPHVVAGRYDLSVNLPYPMDAANEILEPGVPLGPVPQASSSSSSSSTTTATGTPSSFTNVASSSSSAQAGPSNSNSKSKSNSSSQQQPRSSFVILPDLWDDTVEPGMLVVQHMWPFQTPNYIAQPVQPSPPTQQLHPQSQPHHHHNHAHNHNHSHNHSHNHNHPAGPPPGPAGMPHHHHHHHPLPGRGRGARGRGRGGAAGGGGAALGNFGRGHGGGGLVPAQGPPPSSYRPPQIITISRPSTRGKTRKRQDR